jgi:hypothetical protein
LEEEKREEVATGERIGENECRTSKKGEEGVMKRVSEGRGEKRSPR